MLIKWLDLYIVLRLICVMFIFQFRCMTGG